MKYRVHRARFFDYDAKGICGLAYDQGSERIAVLRDGGSIEIWNYRQGMYMERAIAADPRRQLEVVQWSAGRLFAGFQDGDVAELDLLRLGIKQCAQSNYGAVWCLAANEEGSLLAAGTEEGCVCLLDIAHSQLQYLKAFDKQEGRILSIAWHCGEDVIVTGGVNNVRLWSVSSGRAMHRLSLGRPDRKQDTIVWAVAVTSDLTVVSGDSRGKTSFWNGHQGTLIKAFQTHKGAVLTVTVGKEGEVYSSGVDPVIAQFRLVSGAPLADWQQWARTDSLQLHTHDVRAIAVLGSHFVSGGMDTNLVVCSCRKKKQAKLKRWRRYPAVPHRSLVSSAANSPLVLLQYPHCLELVCLGHTNHVPVSPEQSLPLLRDYVRLLVLNACPGEVLLASALSPRGDLLAYSDRQRVHVYRLHTELPALSPSVELTQVKVLDKAMAVAAHTLAFSADSQCLVMTTDTGALLVGEIRENTVSIRRCISLKCSADRDKKHLTSPPSKRRRLDSQETEDSEEETEDSEEEQEDGEQEAKEPVHLLVTSPDGQLAAAADLACRVYVINLHTCQVQWTLPRSTALTTALAFSPDSQLLLLTRTDQTIAEFEVESGRWSAWSRQLSSRLPAQWRARSSHLTGAAYLSPDKMLLYDEQMICAIDKTQPLPEVASKLFSRRKQSASQPLADQQETETATHGFRISHRYKYLLYLRPLGADWLLAVEKMPMSILAALPPSLHQKKYGT